MADLATKIQRGYMTYSAITTLFVATIALESSMSTTYGITDHISTRVATRVGRIGSSNFSNTDSSFEWKFGSVFSIDDSAIVLRIEDMYFKVYDWKIKPYICRRDILFLGVNLCEFVRGDCIVYHKHETACNTSEATNHCNKIMWISVNYQDELSLEISKRRAPEFEQGNWFNIDFKIVTCRNANALTKIDIGEGQTGETNTRKENLESNNHIILILAVALGVLALALIALISALFVREKRRKKQPEKPVRRHGEEPTYQTPQDAYCMAEPLPEQKAIMNSGYDTLVI